MEPPSYTNPQDIVFRRRHLAGPWTSGRVSNPFKTRKANELEINIHQHFASKRYSSGSQINGHVTAKPCKDVSFDTISVKFICQSSVESHIGDLLVETSHHLLDIDMPIPSSIYPEPKILYAGQQFSIPFDFVIPHRLGTAPCAHTFRAEGLRDLHSQAPPSIGCWERDDMTPKGVKIEYAIQATIWSTSADRGPARRTLESKQTIQLLPCGIEHSPLVVPHMSPNYCLEVSKRIRTALFSRAIGQLTISADQPQPIYLEPSGHSFQPTAMTAKIIFQSFRDTSLPPDSCHVSVKLISETWFRDKPMNDFPNLVGQLADHSASETLLTKTSVNLSWEILSNRRQSSSNHEEAPISYQSILELQLPSFSSNDTIFLPTFYSCLSARTYKLRVMVQVGSTSLLLELPVQLLLAESIQSMPDGGIETRPDSESAASSAVRLPSYDDLHGEREG